MEENAIYVGQTSPDATNSILENQKRDSHYGKHHVNVLRVILDETSWFYVVPSKKDDNRGNLH